MTDRNEPRSALIFQPQDRTPALTTAIAAIRQLPDPDRAAAEAMAPIKLAMARSRFGTYAARTVRAWQWVLGLPGPARGVPAESLPGDDHVEYWQHENGRRARISHPYGLSFEDLCGLVDHCRQHGLEAAILPASWYFPGSTVAVVVTAKDRPL